MGWEQPSWCCRNIRSKIISMLTHPKRGKGKKTPRSLQVNSQSRRDSHPALPHDDGATPPLASDSHSESNDSVSKFFLKGPPNSSRCDSSRGLLFWAGVGTTVPVICRDTVHHPHVPFLSFPSHPEGTCRPALARYLVLVSAAWHWLSPPPHKEGISQATAVPSWPSCLCHIQSEHPGEEASL